MSEDQIADLPAKVAAHQMEHQGSDNEPQSPAADEHGNGDDGDDDDGESEEDEESEEEQIEWLAKGRDRRKNQANKYEALLAQEASRAPDLEDEVEQLFAEVEGQEDDEFTDPDASEAEHDIDSSDTDEEDKGPAAGDGELEGEQQLAREERAEAKERKRKLEKISARAAPSRKKVKIDVEASKAQIEERKRKKAERIAALPSHGLRTSSRTLSVQSKKRMQASISQGQAKRARQLAVMRAAQKRKLASKREPLTQAERLEEAARTERVNSKSLNRWEETEKDRVKKQKERLEALHNRKIEGPVIRWHSARGEWWDDRLRMIGKVEVVDHGEAPRKRASKLAAAVEATFQTSKPSASKEATPVLAGVGDTTGTNPSSNASSTILVRSWDPASQHAKDAEKAMNSPLQGPPKDGFATLMEEMHDYASQQTPTIAEQQVPTEEAVEEQAGPLQSTDSSQQQPTPQPADANPAATDTPTDQNPDARPEQATTTASLGLSTPTRPTEVIEPDPLLPSKPHAITYSTHNTITLLSFSDTVISNPTIQRHILLGTPLPTTLPKAAKTAAARATQAPQKPVQPLCAITSQLAKYRDPKTGLAYKDVEAYRRIQKVVKGGCVWSEVLGAWVGGRGEAVTGVPWKEVDVQGVKSEGVV